jgi:hypothetical protein
MPRRPKHYDRPGKRPGPPRSPTGGGSVIDQRGKADEAEQLATFESADGSTRCVGCGLHPDMCTCRPDHPLRQLDILPPRERPDIAAKARAAGIAGKGCRFFDL